MSRLSELIAELCPDGVEYATLDESCFYPRERRSIDDLDEGTYVSVENLAQDFGGLTGEVATTKPGTAVIRFHEGDVLVGNIRPYLKKVWLADFDGGTNGDVLVFRIKDSYSERLLPEFVYMQLASESFINFDMKHAKGAKMPRGDKRAVLRYRIPVPPIEVQREVVRILDEYTAAHDELVRQLEEEMELRKQQLFLSQQSLMVFGGNSEVKWLTVGDLADVSSGATPSRKNKRNFEGVIPWVKTGEVASGDITETEEHISDEALASTACKLYQPGTVLIAMYGQGDTRGKASMLRVAATTNQACAALVFQGDIDPEFALRQIQLRYEELREMSNKGGGQSNLSLSIIKKLKLAVPSIVAQRRFISRYDELGHHGIVDLLKAIEDEISLRKTQLALVRSQLLSFPEKKAV